MANPNPSPETRFKPGQSGNPGGMSAEHWANVRRASEKAALLRAKIIERMAEMIEAGADPIELMSSEALRLFKDSEDRAHGTPKQSVEHTGQDGGPLVVRWEK